jgi:CRISPR/Cas system-associated exonuclease Cas4 (RecB family)
MPIIRASEVGEYVYCARAWWLRRVAGWEPAGRERRSAGVVHHTRHARTVRFSSVLLALSFMFLLLALVFFFIS